MSARTATVRLLTSTPSSVEVGCWLGSVLKPCPAPARRVLRLTGFTAGWRPRRCSPRWCSPRSSGTRRGRGPGRRRHEQRHQRPGEPRRRARTHHVVGDDGGDDAALRRSGGGRRLRHVRRVPAHPPLKARCLRHCRSPLSLLLRYGSYRGPLRDVRGGAHRGAYCLAFVVADARRMPGMTGTGDLGLPRRPDRVHPGCPSPSPSTTALDRCPPWSI